ncbi:MAG: thiamine phosphate synthase [Lachnospiraceae bacterium]
MLLYAVTDRSWLNGDTLASQVEQAIKGGVNIVQLREKNLTGEALKQEALQMQAVCKQYHVPFLIDDDVMLAKEIDADGVHIGQNDMDLKTARQLLGPDKIIGVTAKTVEQAKQAEAGGANYLGSGAVFHTDTKTDTKPLSHDIFQQICESVSIPVVAIGGIHANNVLQLTGRKLSGIAVVSGIFAQPDITKAAQQLHALLSTIVTEEKESIF